MNQLHQSNSPYLLQHKDNPIHWQLWSDKTLQKAQNEDKLLVISIGYSSCHWCHVMAHECFENNHVAEIMNNDFVNIKIDREENPDIDAIYMTALQIMTRQGGWPLNIVALPNGYPIWGCTYLPKEQWTHQLSELTNLYRNDKERVLEYADQLHQHLHLTNKMDLILTEKTTLNVDELFKNWEKTFDYEYGGIDRAPKFIMPTHWHFLLQYSLEIPTVDTYIKNSLNKIATSGINDLVDGGFYRYSVDHYWHIPHFEKMLYDQGQLISVYAKAWLKYNTNFFLETAKQIVQFVLKEWKNEQGGFYGSFDADSLNNNNQSIEGFYYTLTEEEINNMQLKNEDVIRKAYGLNRSFLWEDNYYQLQKLHTNEKLAQFFKKEENEIEIEINQFINECKKIRKQKVKPNLDTKRITSWNAILLNGMIDLYKCDQDINLKKEIDSLYNYIVSKCIVNGKLLHTDSLNENQNELLEDYTFCIQAFLNYFQIDFDTQALKEAKALIDNAFDLFYDDEQKFFTSYVKTDLHIVSQIEIDDNVIPSANSIMADNLYLASILFSNMHYRKVADNMVNKVTYNVDSLAVYSEWHAVKLKWQNQAKYLIAKGYTKSELSKLYSKIKNFNLYIIPFETNIDLAKEYFKMEEKEIQLCGLNQCYIKTKALTDLF